MRRVIIVSFAIWCCVIVSGCSSLMPSFKEPQVNITSFALAPNSVGLAPRFNVGVQVINPNGMSLPLKGIDYSVEIEGNRILSGASPNLPTVPAHGTADFEIVASPDLFGGARLLNDLMTKQRDALRFTFKAQLDVGGLIGNVDIEESGSFSLSGGKMTTGQ